HWLRAGRPEGPWCVEVIDPSENKKHAAKIKIRAALHIHAYYIDLLEDMVERLGFKGPPLDLFLSVTSEADAAQAHKLLDPYRRGALEVRVVPNRGRDIGPFLTAFGARLRSYDVIGHLHTKESHDLIDREFVRHWREYLLVNLVGPELHSADAILKRFSEDPRLGMVYPDDPHLLDWSDNLEIASTLAQRMGIANLPETPPSFPVGMMYWARPAALAPLFDLNLDWSDYPEEPLPYDGSMLHALERLLPIVVAHAGYRRAAVHVPGSTR
ncbi:MAG: rhamnan synthesis F family protein, partial [Gammaproteobacteria bacterium]